MIGEKKKQLRERMRHTLPKDRQEADEKIAQAVLTDPWFGEARTVFTYVSMPDEPDTKRIMEAALASGKTLLVPKCLSKTEMTAVRITSPAQLRPDILGIPEPEQTEPWIGKIDLTLVPCTAASPDGKRLGHGAGYYDRFLSEHPTKTICLCYEERITDDVPSEAHDQVMDRIITQNRILEGGTET